MNSLPQAALRGKVLNRLESGFISEEQRRERGIRMIGFLWMNSPSPDFATPSPGSAEPLCRTWHY
jgi:hypothetical protein